MSKATTDHNEHPNELHKGCGGRMGRMNYCKSCNQNNVDKASIVKGFEVEKGKYVEFTEQDFDNIPTDTQKSLKIDRFVGLTEVDQEIFESSYNLTPDEVGLKPFQLLAEQLNEQSKVALGKFTMSGKEQFVALRGKEKDGILGIIMSTMFYADEIRPMQGIAISQRVQVTDGERKLLGQVINKMTRPFDHLTYHDTYNDALKVAIETKRSGGTIEAIPEKQVKKVSLEDALKSMLDEPVHQDDQSLKKVVKNGKEKATAKK